MCVAETATSAKRWIVSNKDSEKRMKGILHDESLVSKRAVRNSKKGLCDRNGSKRDAGSRRLLILLRVGLVCAGACVACQPCRVYMGTSERVVQYDLDLDDTIVGS